MQSRLARVLVLDENEDLRHLIVYKIQKKLGTQVSEFGSVAEAKEALGREHFDVIVYSHSDWAQGAKLYDELKRNYSHPFQFLMFVGDPGELSEDLRGTVSIIRKPDFDDLLAAIVWPI